MNHIRTLRESRGMTQEQLARLADLKSGGCHVSRLERGVTLPSKRTAQRLADALDAAPEKVFSSFDKLRRW